MFFRKKPRRDVFGEISDFREKTPRSELVKFHNASVRHIKPSPPAGDFFGAFSGPGNGRGSNRRCCLARSNLALIPDEEKQKKKKKKAPLLLWSVKSLPIFEDFHVELGFMLSWCCVVGGPFLVEVYDLLRPSFFFDAEMQLDVQVDEDELEMGERELYEVQLTDVSRRQHGLLLCSTRTRRALHRLTSPTATFES